MHRCLFWCHCCKLYFFWCLQGRGWWIDVSCEHKGFGLSCKAQDPVPKCSRYFCPVDWSSVLTQASPFGERASTRSLPYFAPFFALCFALAVHSTVEQPQVFRNANAHFVLAAPSLQPPYDLCTLAASLWLCADSDRNSEYNLNMWDRVAHSACWANVTWSIHKRCISLVEPKRSVPTLPAFRRLEVRIAKCCTVLKQLCSASKCSSSDFRNFADCMSAAIAASLSMKWRAKSQDELVRLSLKLMHSIPRCSLPQWKLAKVSARCFQVCMQADSSELSRCMVLSMKLPRGQMDNACKDVRRLLLTHLRQSMHGSRAFRTQQTNKLTNERTNKQTN